MPCYGAVRADMIIDKTCRLSILVTMRTYWLLTILLLNGWSLAQNKYDLVIKGGEVIDPRSGVQAVRDVGIRDHKIAAIEKDIPASDATKIIKAHGLLVT